MCVMYAIFYNVVYANFGKYQIIHSHENHNIHQI